jgi:hypothetical protein
MCWCTVSQTRHVTRREEEGNECTVCQQEFVRGATAFCLPCTHTYHEHCILRWLAHSTSCPMCRLPVLAHAAYEDTASMLDALSPDPTMQQATPRALNQDASHRDLTVSDHVTLGEAEIVLAVREALFDFEAAAAKLSATSGISAQHCRERYVRAVDRWAITG